MHRHMQPGPDGLSCQDGQGEGVTCTRWWGGGHTHHEVGESKRGGGTKFSPHGTHATACLSHNTPPACHPAHMPLPACLTTHLLPATQHTCHCRPALPHTCHPAHMPLPAGLATYMPPAHMPLPAGLAAYMPLSYDQIFISHMPPARATFPPFSTCCQRALPQQRRLAAPRRSGQQHMVRRQALTVPQCVGLQCTVCGLQGRQAHQATGTLGALL